MTDLQALTFQLKRIELAYDDLNRAHDKLSSIIDECVKEGNLKAADELRNARSAIKGARMGVDEFIVNHGMVERVG